MTTPAFRRLADEVLKGKIESLRKAVTPMLAGNFLPSFTDHSIGHSDRICEIVDNLTSPLSDRKQLSQTEAFIVYAAAYLHDIGLQHQLADKTQIVSAVLLSEHPGRAWSDLDLETHRNIVRKYHHIISGELIDLSINAPAPTAIGIQLTDDWHPGQIKALAVAHNLYMDSHERAIYQGLTQDWGGFRMSFLSALLRLADILDETRSRSDLYLESTRELTLESRLHWWRHYYVAAVEINADQHTITVWFDFPPSKRAQYRDLILPLQFPAVRAEFDRHADSLARQKLLWHLKFAETPEQQSKSRPMDYELEQFALEKLAKEKERQAHIDRLVMVEQLRVARPTIEHRLAQLRSDQPPRSAEEKLKEFMDLARHLFLLKGQRAAWFMLRGEYNRLASLVDTPLRFEVAMNLAEMMFSDGIFDLPANLLHGLVEQHASLPAPSRFRFQSLLARGYIEQCAYAQAKSALQKAADLASNPQLREEQLALLEETQWLQGDLLDQQATGPKVES